MGGLARPGVMGAGAAGSRRQTAGVTAVDLMLQTRTKAWSPQEWRDVVFAPSTTAPPFGIGDVERDFNWSRPPTRQESERRYVRAYDRGGSYVAGIAGLELPIGNPVHHPDGAPFNPKTPGYWLVDIPEHGEWRIPYLLNPIGLQFTGPKWVCTPRVERAIALGYQPKILEAWIWPNMVVSCWAGTSGSATPALRWTPTIPTRRPRATRPRSSAPTASAHRLQ